MADYHWRNPVPPWVGVHSYDAYEVGNTPQIYGSLYGAEISAVVRAFDSFPLDGQAYTLQEFKVAGSPPGSRVRLSQVDFATGTVRLQSGGYYELTEDIAFEPNPGSNWMPTAAQTTGGASADYPIAPYGPYFLGFFAAITIEGTDILLDLRGHTIRQTDVFNLQQRFFAAIELASSPFVPGQGPGDFGSTFVAAKDSYICNGTLATSSHHGIHGNAGARVLIQNLIITNFEVAGIALNGFESTLIRNVSICGMAKHIPVLSTYSSARFVPQFLEAIIGAGDGPVLALRGGDKTGRQILDALNAEAATVLEDVVAGRPVQSTLFANPSGIYDGNGYGVVLGARGVVVGPFPENRQGAVGNVDVVVHDVRVEDAAVGSGEIIGICRCNPSGGQPAYGGASQVGPVGELFQIKVAADGQGLYAPNVLADAELYVGTFGVGASQRGKTNIETPILDWALASNTESIDQVMVNSGLYYVSGGDSMGHVMKGYIQYFIAAGKEIRLWNLRGDSTSNRAPPGVLNAEATAVKPGVKPLEPVYQGASSRGLAIAGSTRVFAKDVEVSGLGSAGGMACALDLIGSCDGVRVRTGVVRKSIRGSGLYTGAPNPPGVGNFCLVDPASTHDIEVV